MDGDRVENEAVTIASAAYGVGGVEKVNSWGNQDPWHVADLICVAPDLPMTVIQVKTGYADKETYRQRAARRFPDDLNFEVWERFERSGWKMHRLHFAGEPWNGRAQESEWSVYYQTDICDEDKIRDSWADRFEEKF